MSKNSRIPDKYSKVIAEILNELRESKGLSLSQIAEKVEIGRATVYDCFDGKNKNPSSYGLYCIVVHGLGLKFRTFAKKLEERELDFE